MLWTRFSGGRIRDAVERVQDNGPDNGPHAIRADREHSKLDPIFQQLRHEQETASKDKKSKHPLLIRAIWRAYKNEAAMFKLGWSIFIVVSIAYFIREILLYINFKQIDQDHTSEETLWGILHAVFFVVCVVIFSLSLEQCNWVSTRLGLKVQGAITSQIFIKALFRAEGTGSKANIVAMVSKDVAKIADAVSSLQFLWSGIFESVVIFAILLGLINYNALPGLAVFLVMLPFQYWLGLWIARKKVHISGLSSERAQATEEILRAMKLIKMYAWEKAFSEKVFEIRDKELNAYKWQTVGKTFLIASVFMMPPLFVAAIFGVYEINNEVKGALAFTTLTLFNTLRLPLVKLPKALRDVTDARLAIQRIEEFLLEPEIEDNEEDHQSSAADIVMTDASFSHHYKATTPPYLQNINLDVKQGSLLIVAGSVGTGKSSLIKAILRQMHLVSGTSHVGGTYAYVPQTPWCALGTVRENILFGRKYDNELFDKVCHACALETDFKLFKDGDMTWIGERGGNLSGGQKQRIALARACYSQNDVMVLDSPLSAVDMHTCMHIFEKCIKQMMLGNGKTVVLVTHQVELFCHADHLIVMDDASFKYSGPYDPKAVKQLFPNAHVGPQDSHADGKGDSSAPHVNPTGPPSTGPEVTPKWATGNGTQSIGGNDSPTRGIKSELLLYGRDVPKSQQEGFQKSLPVKRTKEEILRQVVVEDDSSAVVKAPIVIDAAALKSAGWYELLLNWGPLTAVVLCLFLLPAAQGCRTFSDIWISQWTNKKKTWGGVILSEWSYFGIYAGFTAGFFIFRIIGGTYHFWMGISATRKIHANAFNAMMRAQMAFFNVTPMGKTLNFFAKDMDIMDDSLHDNVYMVQLYAWILVFTFYVLISNVTYYAIVIGVCFVLFMAFLYYYMKAAKIVKLHLSGANSVLVAHVAESLTGLGVVRAFRVEPKFLQTNFCMQNDLYRAGVELNNCNHWISFRVDLLGTILVACTVFLAILLDDSMAISDSAAGLMVSNCLQILLFFSASVTLFGEINTQISAVDRSLKLKNVDVERDMQKDDVTGQAPQGWPSSGVVEFSNVVMSYIPNTPPVLKGVNFKTQAGEKIGVVGRTGAGKSTLIMAMFRLAEMSEGTIHIDKVKVDSILLQQLRSKIAIIPQEPVMFKGTLRSNLDPFGKHSDTQLVEVLNKCLLHSLINYHAADMGLSAEVEAFGTNYSLGQQQLLCLARAMLTPSKLLLLDEATAALDSDTDAAVQKVLRENFKDRTIITIAHRLDTIIDSDKILSMDAGKVAEFDTPKNLLQKPDSIFASLCKNTGEAEYQRLFEAAMKHADSYPGPMHQAGGQFVSVHMPQFAFPAPSMQMHDPVVVPLPAVMPYAISDDVRPAPHPPHLVPLVPQTAPSPVSVVRAVPLFHGGHPVVGGQVRQGWL